MNSDDIARCQQAIALANSGQRHLAYEQFCALYNRGNAQDVTLLYWIAATTPVWGEAQSAIETIARLEPNHPRLQELQAYVNRTRYEARIGPVMTCPYCHYTGPARIGQKIATAGWVFFGVVLILFFPLCWIGLLMKNNYYACGRCGIALGNVM